MRAIALSVLLVASAQAQSSQAERARKAFWAYTAHDYQAALKLAEPAAAAGSPLGAYVLGRLWTSGSGVPKDSVVGAQWHQKAAAAAKPASAKGDRSAQYVLGQALQEGLGGLPKDSKAALSLMRKSADAGFAPAQRWLGVEYSRGGGLLERDFAAALEWFRKAAAQDLPGAVWDMGVVYEKGEGVPADKAAALKWYGRAMALGSARASYSAGVLHQRGEGTAQDYAEARRLYEAAAAKGFAPALVRLGYLHERGLGVTQDKAKGAELYRKAAELGNATGQYNMGAVHEAGSGVPLDGEAARRWYRKAAEQGFRPSADVASTALWAEIVAEVEKEKKAAAVPKPSAPAKLSAKVAFSEPSGDDVLDAYESGELKVAVSNAGPGPAYAVEVSAALLQPVAGLEIAAPVKLGTLEPGREASAVLRLSGSEALATARVKAEVAVKEGNGFDAPATLVEFPARAFRAPRLELAAVSLGGAGVAKAGEVAKLRLSVRNSGAGAAEDVSAALVLGSADLFNSGEPSVSLGTLAPGRTASVELEFFVNNRFKGSALPVALKVVESRGRFGFERPLGLALGEAPASPAVMRIAGKEAAPAPAPAPTEAEDVDLPPAAKSAADPEAFAVVVGVERYRQKGLPAVEFAARDAQTVHGYLTRSMGFDEKNVVLLQNEQATKTDLEKYLGTWLKNRVTDKSRVFVYYAGHGAPDPATGDAYLLPYEGDPAYTADTAFSLQRLYQSLGALPAREVLVALDACFSGQGERSVLAKGARPLVSSRQGRPSGRTVVLAAAGGGQISTSYPEGRHGLLTYHLLKGLRGAADADGDGRVTTAQLFGYVRPAVEREARRQNVEQTPTLSPPLSELGARSDEVWLELKR